MKTFAIIFSMLLSFAQTTKVVGPVKVAGPVQLNPPAGGVSWTLVQHPNNLATCLAVTSCSITGVTTTAGNLLVLMVAVFNNVGGVTISSASGDSSWTHCPSSAANVTYSAGNNLATDCSYILSAAGGSGLTITATISGTGANFDVELVEFHRSTGTATFDTGGTNTSSSCSSCVSATPTLTGTDVVIQWMSFENANSTVSSPYNTAPSPDIDNIFGGSFAWALNQSSGAAATWTCTTGGASMSTVAFK